MDSYQTGYIAGVEATFAEIYATIDDDDHPKVCGGDCRPCGVIRTSLEDGMRRIGARLTPDEFTALAGMLARVNREG